MTAVSVSAIGADAKVSADIYKAPEDGKGCCRRSSGFGATPDIGTGTTTSTSLVDSILRAFDGVGLLLVASLSAPIPSMPE
jgi:hypothetical protein